MIPEEMLMDVELGMEGCDLQLGAERFREAQERKAKAEGYEALGEVQRVIRGGIPILAEAIREWRDREDAKGRGKRSPALAPLRELDPDVVAFGTLSKVFSGVHARTPVTRICIAIGSLVQVEYEGLMLKAAADDDEVKRLIAGISSHGSRRSLRKKTHEELAETLGVGLGWDDGTLLRVGGIILNVVLEALGEVFVRGEAADKRGHPLPVINLTDEAAEMIAKMGEAAAWAHPLLHPMIVPPRPWERFDTGAYLRYELSKTVPLVKTRTKEHRQMIVEAIKDGSMSDELRAMNLIQETRFAIDSRVLRVIRWAADNGRKAGKGFPSKDTPEIPKKLPEDEWEALSQEARHALSRRRKSLRDIKLASATDMQVLMADLEEADRLTDAPAFYLPATMDFRGRVYAVPHFNPQRSDHIKALFRFADAVALGEDGGKWLMIHLANCGDFEKVSKKAFDQRVQWVRDHEEEILGAAADPEGTFGFWSEADEPFCFLQACFEYAEWASSGYSVGFESSIAIALDGSCSGLQHYSAITRSAEEGYHVNLLPRPEPGDIYNVVTEAARPVIRQQAEEGSEAASLILSNDFGRADAKRNVMTYFYGSAKFGMRDQHMQDKMNPLADRVALGEIQQHPYAIMQEKTNPETGEVSRRLDGGFTCAQMLASAVYGAVVATAPKADEASEWFQKVASVLAHEGKSVCWRVPTGLPVMQRYSEYTSKRVEVWLRDAKVSVPSGRGEKAGDGGSVLSRLQLLVREAPTRRIDKRKAKSAISPNVIHSLDGSHLKRVILMAADGGIRHFKLIHDSFATHAGNTERFSRIIREAFVAQYADYCPMVAIDTYARSVLSDEAQEKLPPIPPRGTLDIREVLEAVYAFA